MRFQYSAVYEAVKGPKWTSKVREIATLAYTLKAEAATVLAALPHLGLSEPTPGCVPLLQDLGVLDELPGRIGNPPPDWRGEGVEIWVLSRRD